MWLQSPHGTRFIFSSRFQLFFRNERYHKCVPSPCFIGGGVNQQVGTEFRCELGQEGQLFRRGRDCSVSWMQLQGRWVKHMIYLIFYQISIILIETDYLNPSHNFYLWIMCIYSLQSLTICIYFFLIPSPLFFNFHLIIIFYYYHYLLILFDLLLRPT